MKPSSLWQKSREPMRRGFTLIELLAVIGIIMLLGALLVIAIRGVERSARARATKATLENLRGMLADLDVSTRLAPPPPAWQWGGVAYAPPAADSPCDFWRVPHMTGSMPDALPAPGPVTPDWPANRWQSDAAVNTMLAMRLIASLPSNRTAIARLPANQLLQAPAGGPALLNGTPVTVLLDGWGNPIIFVSATGLDVSTPGVTKIIRSGGVLYAAGQPLRPSDRPFFASPGPDGNFTTDGDNLYSFEN